MTDPAAPTTPRRALEIAEFHHREHRNTTAIQSWQDCTGWPCRAVAAARATPAEALPPDDVRTHWHMESLIRYAVEVWGPESDVDSEADNASMQADLETFLDAESTPAEALDVERLAEAVLSMYEWDEGDGCRYCTAIPHAPDCVVRLAARLVPPRGARP